MIGRRKLTGTAGPALEFEVGSTVGLLIGSLNRRSTWPGEADKQRAYHSRCCQGPDRAWPKTAAFIAQAVKNHLEIPAGHAKLRALAAVFAKQVRRKTPKPT